MIAPDREHVEKLMALSEEHKQAGHHIEAWWTDICTMMPEDMPPHVAHTCRSYFYTGVARLYAELQHRSQVSGGKSNPEDFAFTNALAEELAAYTLRYGVAGSA